MIEIICNQDAFFVYKLEDWIKLRVELRIIGEIQGGESIPSLPLKLYPHEVALLLEIDQARLCTSKILNDLKTQEYNKLENGLLEAQRTIFQNRRRKQLETVKDKIIAKRRLKGDERDESEILEEELNRSSQVTGDNLIWPILIEPLGFETKAVDIDLAEVKQSYRFLVFKDLWKKNYYITTGEKFGGDFLLYLGDPLCYHAVFIVKCVDKEEELSCNKIIAFGRLGVSVKKRAVLATVDDNQINYITFTWIDA